MQIIGSNIYGQSNDEIIINRITNLPSPEVYIIYPTNNPHESLSTRSLIRATILNVNDKYDISFYVNGLKSFNFNFFGNQFEAKNIQLRNGKNTIKIIGSNSQGSSFDEVLILYKPPYNQLPKVIINSPNINPFTSNKITTNIKATVLNVTDRSNISFSLNGRSIKNFQFSGNILKINNLLLSEGSNLIIISGKNSMGSSYDKTVIKYVRSPNNNYPPKMLPNIANHPSVAGMILR